MMHSRWLFASLFLLLSSAVWALEAKTYQVYIVSDTLKPKFVELADGFRAGLDKQLAAVDAKAVYTVFDTKTDPATVPGILKAITEGQPDLICTINSSGVFADTNITKKLTDPKYRFVSENCIPVQSGLAKTYAKPGGNVTGVGVFPPFAPLLKMAKLINPQVKRVYFYSWGAMKPVNAWFQDEITAACKAEGLLLADFHLNDSAEDQYEYCLALDQKGSDVVALEGLSAWVHRDGTYADMTVEGARFIHENIKNLLFVNWDEAGTKAAYPAGITIVWYDLGAQLADQAYRVLKGARPGDLPWENPRKHEIVLNLAGAKQVGLKLPEVLVSAAYRVYTDFDGHYVGQKN